MRQGGAVFVAFAWALVSLATSPGTTAGSVAYTYDAAGRLTLVDYGGGRTIAYAYDKLGNMASRIVTAGAGPAITGVVNGASFLPGTAASTWITIQGTNLSQTTRTWKSSDFVTNNLPTVLDGVSATSNGIAAYVYYISPTQLNVLAPW